MDSTKVVDFGSPRGRGIAASRDFKAGETVFSESPLLCCQFSWNRLYGYLACDHCMRPLESAENNARRLTNNNMLVLPYPQCDILLSMLAVCRCDSCGVYYCSPECLNSASVLYHSVICPRHMLLRDALTHLDETWRQMHYPPETSTVMLLVRIIGSCISAHLRHSSLSQQIVEALKGFVSDTVVTTVDSNRISEMSHKLLRPEFVPQMQNLHESFVLVLEKISQVCCSQTSPGVECSILLRDAGLSGLLDINNFKSALCLLGRNGQGVATSAFSLWVRNAEKYVESLGDVAKQAQLEEFLSNTYSAMNEHVGSFLDNEGVALYQYQSLINHGCSPNSRVEFSGETNKLTIVADREITSGEEITISYLDDCLQSRSRHSRRKYLSANYLFWCECDRCLREKLEGAASETSESDDTSDDEALHTD